jgi:DNA mismatch endonuclease (patch repair protein)
MADVLSAAQRSYCMSRIRGKDTKPEHIIRRGLFALGFRYRLHRRDLPGCPDLTLPKYRAVIFIHGCLWHGHECHMFKWPSTNADFWRRKITTNRANDSKTMARLKELDWRVLTVWECAVRGRGRLNPDKLLSRAAAWLLSSRRADVIQGRRVRTH